MCVAWAWRLSVDLFGGLIDLGLARAVDIPILGLQLSRRFVKSVFVGFYLAWLHRYAEFKNAHIGISNLEEI